MALTAIVEYYTKPGHEEQVATLLAGHWSLLHDEGFTTDQPAFLMRDPQDSGLFVEVFEWRDEAGPDRAWEHPAISELWNQLQSLCEEEIAPDYYDPVRHTQSGGG